ncbi:MAG: DivIVA domain-containing protein [Clostridia bacterium]|nr:DivIVA domain-containing protein [Clostridia bacterium]
MGLTPLDLQNRSFKVSFRGYNQLEVNSFIDKVAREFEQLYRQNVELKEKLSAYQELVEKYRSMEETIRNSIVVAEKAAEELRLAAAKEAENLRCQAEIQAEQILKKAQAEVEKIQGEYLLLRRQVDRFKNSFKALLTFELENLERGLEISVVDSTSEAQEEAACSTELPQEE